MTKTISAKKKFKKCLRINTVLASVGLCDGGHLWLRQNSAAMSSPRWHVRWHGIYGCGRIQHPCHPHAGMCDGLGSMAAAEFSSHVIPTLACAAAWDLWLRHLGICPSYYENPTLHIGVCRVSVFIVPKQH